jgi:hypothetical protein
VGTIDLDTLLAWLAEYDGLATEDYLLALLNGQITADEIKQAVLSNTFPRTLA